MASGLDSLLFRLGGQLDGPASVAVGQSGRAPFRASIAMRLEKALAPVFVPGVRIEALSLKGEADKLYDDYLHSAIGCAARA